MKRLTAAFLIFSLLTLQPTYGEPIYGQPPAYGPEQNAFIPIEEPPIGVCAKQSVNQGVGLSMMGWGIGAVIGISILALVLHQSVVTAHSSSSSTSSESGSGGTDSFSDSSYFSDGIN